MTDQSETAREILMARHRYEEAVRILREHADPRSNPGAHALAVKVLVALGEREGGAK